MIMIGNIGLESIPGSTLDIVLITVTIPIGILSTMIIGITIPGIGDTHHITVMDGMDTHIIEITIIIHITILHIAIDITIQDQEIADIMHIVLWGIQGDILIHITDLPKQLDQQVLGLLLNVQLLHKKPLQVEQQLQKERFKQLEQTLKDLQ